MSVELVFTERHRDLTKARSRNYERLRARVTAAAGEEIGVSHYEDVDAGRLERADAVVLSGSTAAWSSRDVGELARLGEAILGTGRPVLGICAGMQLLARFAGGAIALGGSVEHGFLPIRVLDHAGLLRDFPPQAIVYQDHTDEIVDLPAGFDVLAASDACAVQAFACLERHWWGTQFHPEESSEQHPTGARVLENFFALVR